MKQNLKEQEIIAQNVAMAELVEEREKLISRLAEIDAVLKPKKRKKAK